MKEFVPEPAVRGDGSLPVLAQSAEATAAHAADLADLGDEIWWEETLSVGDFSTTVRCQPDRWARETIVASILMRAGFKTLRDAMKRIVAEADEAARHDSATGGGLDGWNSAEAGAYERCADIAREALAAATNPEATSPSGGATCASAKANTGTNT